MLKKLFHFFIHFYFKKVKKDDYDFFRGYGHLAAGLCCGLSSLVIILNIFKEKNYYFIRLQD